MSCNEAGLLIIEESEALRLVPYVCPAGKLTVGWGHTGPDVVQGRAITRAIAEAMLKLDVIVAENAVTRYAFPARLNENQFSALVSFVFNVGAATFRDHDMRKYITLGEFELAAEEFPKWNKAKDPKTGELRVLDGLTKRRARERALFETPVEGKA